PSSIPSRPVYINVVLFLLNRRISEQDRPDQSARIIYHRQNIESAYNPYGYFASSGFQSRCIYQSHGFHGQRSRQLLILDSSEFVLRSKSSAYAYGDVASF